MISLKTVMFQISLVVGASSLGCAGELPIPRSAEAKFAPASVVVTHPPPAALPEIVPEKPQRRAVWLDGYWTYRGDNWVWIRGAWVDASPKLALVASRFWVEEAGVLHFTDRVWVDEAGEPQDAPQVLRSAATPPTATLPETATVP